MTVQDRPHVGHVRAALASDVMRRWLERRGFEVSLVTNFTDVDDRILARAAKEGVPWRDVAERNVAAWMRVSDRYGILRATRYPRATEHVPEILDLVRVLVERGHAYARPSPDGAGSDVWFDVDSYAGYGRLSGRRLDEVRSGTRIEPSEAKDDPADFALWKAAKPGEASWPSPWGPGRPGWHVECSAMSVRWLGQPFDLHGGGQDLLFPHHENERAQTEAATGSPLTNHWCESGLVTTSGAKMSKSAGPTVSAEELASTVDPEAVRLYLLGTHYRGPIEFSTDRLREAEASLSRLRSTLERTGAWTQERPASGSPAPAVAARVAEAETAFEAAMDDDFHAPRALAVAFDLARDANRALDEGDAAAAATTGRAVRRLFATLGLFAQAPAGAEWPAEVLALARDREEARRARDFARADVLRRRLRDLGAVVEDGPGGPRLSKA
jgi:cysteinyl-tRNA synthetase